MKKITCIISILTLVLTCTVNDCSHKHNDECGYNPITDEGCTHVCLLIDPRLGLKGPDEE